jgi:hypothetical protein
MSANFSSPKRSIEVAEGEAIRPFHFEASEEAPHRSFLNRCPRAFAVMNSSGSVSPFWHFSEMARCPLYDR